MTDFNVGKYAVDDRNGDLVIEHPSNGDVLRYDEANDVIIPEKGLGTASNAVPASEFESVLTQEATVQNETFVRANRASNSSSTSSAIQINIFDNELTDKRDEFDSNFQFSPDESGEYLINVAVDFRGSTSVGDNLLVLLKNATDSTTVVTDHQQSADTGGGQGFTLTPELDSAKTYEIVATNDDSSFIISAADTEGTIHRILAGG